MLDLGIIVAILFLMNNNISIFEFNKKYLDMIKIKSIITTAAVVLLGTASFSQTVLLSGQLGYYNPVGDIFDASNGEDDLSSVGLGVEGEALYFIPSLDDKVGVGLMFNSSIMIGKEDDNITDIGVYGLSLYGVKGQYRLSGFEKSVTPYGSLGLGLARFKTPEIKSGNTVIAEGNSATAFGIRPEIGLDLGGFLLSAAYFVPMSYEFESDLGNFDGSAGAWSISIGYTTKLDF